MKGKITMIIVVLITIIAIILTWVYLQNVMEEYDVDERSIHIQESNYIADSLTVHGSSETPI